MQLRWLLSVPVLSFSLRAAAAPAVAPSDARGSFAVYCESVCGPINLPGWEVVDKLPEGATTPSYTSATHGTDFGMPDAATLAAWGTGDVGGAANAQSVVVVSWAGPKEGAAGRVAEIGQALVGVGRWFEDLDTGRFFDQPELRGALQSYAGSTPDVTALMTIEMSEHEEGTPTRLVTRGLRKVGVADLVMSNVSSMDEGAMVTAVNAVAQVIYEQGVAPTLTINADTFRSRAVADDSCGIVGKAELSAAKRRGGDPEGPLTDVVFEGNVGTCERTSAAPPLASDVDLNQGMVMLWVDDPKDDGGAERTLADVRAQELQRLAGPVKQAWERGLPEGEQLLVKAPFRAEDGSTEWLWFRVDRWDSDDQLSGRLVSEPARAKQLESGDRVVAARAQVFDYLWFKSDGTQEGNATQAFVH
jgi:hypothetical protein